MNVNLIDHRTELGIPSRQQIVICTPLFWGGASGASVYYRLLSQSLIQHGCNVSVVSDKEPSELQPSVEYFSLFPARCGRKRKLLLDYFAYAAQNLAYFNLNKIVGRVKPRAVLIHSSFYNHPGIFAHVMKEVIRKNPRVNSIADVRDGLMPPVKVPLLNAYRRVIACSENVMNHLLENGVVPDRLIKIPVIQERLQVDDELRKRLLGEMAMNGRPYIFFGGLVKESKAVDLLLEAFLAHVRPARPDILLVIAGLMKTSSKRIRDLLAQDGVLYVGNRRRDEVLALMSAAALCVNLSPNEGMPRSSLEALALGRPVLLPPNVPEFARHCRDFVVGEHRADAVAAQMLSIIDAGIVPDYPIGMHYPENILPAYIDLLAD